MFVEVLIFGMLYGIGILWLSVYFLLRRGRLELKLEEERHKKLKEEK